jgi:4-hydroxy-tetrahydrodipicolinate reductase
MRVGLMGYGKAGRAVARVLAADARFDLSWIARRHAEEGAHMEEQPGVPIVGLAGRDLNSWFDEHPVDAIVDFSDADTLFLYGEELRRGGITLVSAISAYTPEHQNYLRELAQHCRIMSSPNITLGINFLLMAAKLLRDFAPFADVEVVEQHFRDKPEISGTARRIAESLELEEDRITSLRVGGIVGHHEVIFGFPHQTVRLIHDSIRREAFGTGAAFALLELDRHSPGLYSFDDLLMEKMQNKLMADRSA